MKKFVRYSNEIMKYQTRNKKATQTHTHTHSRINYADVYTYM